MPYFPAPDGHSLYYDVVGDDDAPLVVVLPGGPGRHPVYLGTLGSLAEHRRLAILHPRGVGESTDAAPRSFLDQVDDLEALRQHLGLDALDLLAHSSGTRIALAYTAAHPSTVATLVLVSPPAAWLLPAGTVPDDTAEIIARHQDEPWFPAYRTALAAFAAARNWDDRVTAYRGIAPISWARWNDNARAHERLGAWYPDAQAAFPARAPAGAIWAGLGRFDGTGLVIVGDSDGLTGLAPVLALGEALPNTTTVVIRESGHYPWVEQPEEFAAAIAGALHLEHDPREPRGRRRTRSTL